MVRQNHDETIVENVRQKGTLTYVTRRFAAPLIATLTMRNKSRHYKIRYHSSKEIKELVSMR